MSAWPTDFEIGGCRHGVLLSTGQVADGLLAYLVLECSSGLVIDTVYFWAPSR